MRRLLSWSLVACCLAFFAVAPADAATRAYFISADEVLWNYAPSGANVLTGKPLRPPGPQEVGYRYKKAVYRAYIDATFRARAPEPAYLGAVGPPIYAEVGDTIVVTFRNATHFPVSMHPHGVFYEKTSAGAQYVDGSITGRTDGAVSPGRTIHYTWDVPERAGPGPMDGSSVLWMYHSHTHEVADVAAGLLGPIVVTRKGAAKDDGSPNDVDREVFTTLDMVDENQSTYFVDNFRTFVRDRAHVTADMQNNPVSPFYASNEIAAINGYVFGNGPLIEIRRGERVRWYLVSGASDYFNYHTAHWHGMTGLASGMRMDMIELLPGSMKTIDFVPDNPGVWLFHCHVGPHLLGGMVTRFRVAP